MRIEEKACVAISREYNSEKSKRFRQLFVEGKHQQILAECDVVELENLIRNCVAQGISIVTRESTQYPEKLLRLGRPPYVLYCRGNLELLQKPSVAIVGTRDCTRYGQTVAEDFGKKLAENGIVVVSGLAEGIDTAGHKGAIDGSRTTKPKNKPKVASGIINSSQIVAKGSLPLGFEFPEGVVHVVNNLDGGVVAASSSAPTESVLTIAVLGNGLNVNFPASNFELQKQLSQHGLVISEFLPNTPCSRITFPWRNRIVAALSSAVIIVEADIKSGTMITRDWALELGVEVFAVPGQITSNASRGTNAIIKDAACSILTDIADVLDVFGITEKSKLKPNAVVQLSFDEKLVVDAIKNDEVHFDEIIEKTSLPVRKLTSMLTNMELNGLIKKLAGNLYARIK